MGKHKRRQRSDIPPIDLSNLKFFYGIPHCHTEISTGKGTPLEALEYGKKNGLNFMILTDHNSYLSEMIPYKGEKISKWKFLKTAVDRFNKKHDDFIALIGFEANSVPWGHINIINCQTYFKGIVKDLNNLMLWLIADGNSFFSINHPSSTVELVPYNPLFNYFLNCIEVGNGSPPHKYSRYDKTYFSMLDKGWLVGAINSQDNHRLNFGESENLTAVVCNSFDKASIVDSFKKRHTYSTESKTLKLYFTINSAFMGHELELTSPTELNFLIFAEDYVNPIEKIQIISSGGKVVKELQDIGIGRIKYLLTLPHSPENKWYVIKVFQKGNKQALTSPIFIKIKNS